MSNELLAAVLGAIVGALGGGAVEAWRQSRADAKRDKNTARAINAEIQAIAEILRKVRMVEEIRRYGKAASEGVVKTMDIRVKEEYLAFTKDNLEHVGSLEDPLPQLVSLFLVYNSRAMEDIHRLYEDPDRLKNVDPVKFYNDLADVYHQILETADAIRENVRLKYPN